MPGFVISEVNQQAVDDGGRRRPSSSVRRKEAGRPAVLFKVTDPTGQSRFIAVRLN